MKRRRSLLFLSAAMLILSGCGQRDTRPVITIWHQSRPTERAFLHDEIALFEAANPNVRVRALYKETEELRSGFQAAVLAGGGPELVYGPSDVLGALQTMGVLRDMKPLFSHELSGDFVEGALTHLPSAKDSSKIELVQVADRFGNHLALVYNRKLVPSPPTTTDELVAIAKANTLDDDHDGQKERYGIVWNFTEPFFGVPFLTGYGGWVFEENDAAGGEGNSDTPQTSRPVPSLDTPEAVEAWRFMQSLRVEHGVTPKNCDYELADLLFKKGRAAMIINGDWSWDDYLETPEFDAAVAVLPVVTATGQPMRTMFSPKGYSLNVNAPEDKARLAIDFVEHMVSDEVQRRLVDKLQMLPARRSIQQDPLFASDATLKVSLAQLENGRLMPTATELRAVWDGMRPPYQGLLSGAVTPELAAKRMQQDSVRNIDMIYRDFQPGWSMVVLQVLGVALLLACTYWLWRGFGRLAQDWPRNRIAYLFAFPAVAVVFCVVVFPFFYNIVLSFSNMSLSHYQDWQMVGWQNYSDLFTDPELAPKFWYVFFKTIVWTAVNVAFHVGLGLLLAVALNGPVRGKSLYRVLLIIPWAVPAYITALTWRGMFDAEYGAINVILAKAAQIPPIGWLLDLVNLTPPVNWLGDVGRAFQACIVTNVWLGFPFMMVIALGGMQGIPHELYEAARIDRASRWQQFWHITLPMLKPVLLPAVTLGTIWTFNNLNVIWLVSNGGEPQDQTHILVSYVYKSAFNLYRYGYGAALSMVIFFILLVFSMLFLYRTKATESVYG
jgi:arabinogalactan oligomer/maltooligosaccharide transport system permease protein